MRKVDWWKVSFAVALAATVIVFGVIVMTPLFGDWGALVGVQVQGVAIVGTVVLGSPFYHPLWRIAAGVFVVFEQLVVLLLLYGLAMASMDVTGHDFFPFQVFWTCLGLFEPAALFLFGVFCAEHERMVAREGRQQGRAA